MAQRVGRVIALLFHDRGTRRGEWSATRPGRTLPPGKTWYQFYRRLGGPQGRSGRAENLVPTGILFLLLVLFMYDYGTVAHSFSILDIREIMTKIRC